jgi:hypothetical protein
MMTGCSTFNREWKAAAVEPIPADTVAGRWEGLWLSDVNGHDGRLRCLVTRAGDKQYQAHYRATYWKCFRFSYRATMQIEKAPGDDAHTFQGEADLGWWGGGVYRYEGRITSTNFFSTYRSKYDHGTFRMKRLQ